MRKYCFICNSLTNKRDYITLQKSSQDCFDEDDEENFMGFKERYNFEENNCYCDSVEYSDKWLEMSYNYFNCSWWDTEDEECV